MRKARVESWVKHAVRRWRQLYETLLNIERGSEQPTSTIIQPPEPQVESITEEKPANIPSSNGSKAVKKSPTLQLNFAKEIPESQPSSTKREKNTGRFTVEVKTLE